MMGRKRDAVAFMNSVSTKSGWDNRKRLWFIAKTRMLSYSPRGSVSVHRKKKGVMWIVDVVLRHHNGCQ